MWKSSRVEAYQEGEVDEARQLELDTVEEARINTLTQSARYLQGVRRYLLSVETHRRAATGSTKSREVAGALAGTAPLLTARNSVTRPEIP